MDGVVSATARVDRTWRIFTRGEPGRKRRDGGCGNVGEERHHNDVVSGDVGGDDERGCAGGGGEQGADRPEHRRATRTTNGWRFDDPGAEPGSRYRRPGRCTEGERHALPSV